MKKYLVNGMLFVLFCLFSATGFADTKSTTGDSKSFHKIDKKLNLTKPQKIKFEKVLKDNVPKIKALAGKLKSLHKQTRTFVGEKYDQSKVNDIAKKQGDLISEIIVLKAKMRNDIYNILTPKQRVIDEKRHQLFLKMHPYYGH